jgi:ketosteroid isomerase-like protein
MPESRIAAAESDALATLRDLNANYIRAFAESDVTWYREHLAPDFVCTLADGRRIDKPGFLGRNAEGPGVTDINYELVDIKLMGDVALVHGTTLYTRDGTPSATSYTDVWWQSDDRWQAVAAQLTAVAKPASVRGEPSE